MTTATEKIQNLTMSLMGFRLGLMTLVKDGKGCTADDLNEIYRAVDEMCGIVGLERRVKE